MEKEIVKEQNPLGTRPIPQMLLSLAVPAVIANLVNAVYNIVDQIFIGNKIGYLGNAATNVAFPLTTICMAIGLMVGLGSAVGFNLNLGKKETEKAKGIAGTAFTSLLLCGILICILVRFFCSRLWLPLALRRIFSLMRWSIPVLPLLGYRSCSFPRVRIRWSAAMEMQGIP